MLGCNGLIGPVGGVCRAGGCVKLEERKGKRDPAETVAPSTSAMLPTVFASR